MAHHSPVSKPPDNTLERTEVQSRRTVRRILAFVVSAGMAAAVWALSVPLTGNVEPWDAHGPYYLFALAIAGALSGAVVPRHLPFHYVGAVVGQAAYELAFLKVGALFVLGLVFLAAYSVIFIGAAAIVASLRSRRTNGAIAV